MEFDHVLTTTPSVRRKLDLERPVENEVLAECLELALHAPTPANQQSWRWLVVRDQDVKNRLGELFRRVGQAYLGQYQAAAEADPAVARSIASGQYLIDVIERVPAFVVPCVQGRTTGANVADAVLYGGIFPAVWSFQLALRSRGLGSTLTTYHLQTEAEAAEILGVPEGYTQACLLPVAYTTTTDFKPTPRRPVSEVAYLDHWGKALV
ncbi:nitroreductase family protein [Amycolatopsis rhabdoformis]|uniref:Nitroreductase family protein n=1 Tax=Amycolatopsis rhabdoformis TaxID=1448059 RepID=A0ABZ1IKJ3_9PSEU|nr:nitroreductase family protein [Amycolatopsis rhabdoformis]WSE34406.1 nitroreductase family protein [Amycolatopsis rhabdoformis]